LRFRALWQRSAIGERREVRLSGQLLGLEPPHLAGRGCGPIHALASDDRTHHWIMSETPGIVHVLVAGEPPIHCLAQQAPQLVPNVGAAPPFAESCRCHRRQTESVVQLAIGEQTAVRGDPGAMKLKLDPAIEGDPKSGWLPSPVASAILGSFRRPYCFENYTIDVAGHQNAALKWEMGVQIDRSP
jgi:hypothetical protein